MLSPETEQPDGKVLKGFVILGIRVTPCYRASPIPMSGAILDGNLIANDQVRSPDANRYWENYNVLLF
jgi:hypothetical protein